MSVDIDRIFSDLTQIGHSNFPDSVRDRVRFFIEEIERFREGIGKPREEVRVLDVGCGVGKNSLAFAHTGFRVLAIDNGEESLAYLDRENTFPNLNIQMFDLYESDYDTLPGEFDVIVVASILEHLENPGEILRKLMDRAVKPCLVLGDLPNGYGAAEWAHWLRRKVRRSWGETTAYRRISSFFRYKRSCDETDSVTLTDTPHIHDFSWPMLKLLLQNRGLDPPRARNVNFLTGTPIVQKVFLGTRAAQKFDVAMAQVLPHWMANGWFFSAAYRPKEPASGADLPQP